MNHLTTGKPVRSDESAAETSMVTAPVKPKQRAGSHLFLYILGAVIVGAVVAFNVIRPITVLPRITPAPGFALTDQNGQVVTSEDFRGALTLYSFSYTSCENGCSQSLEQISALRDELSTRLPADIPLSFATISIDPAHDSSDRLNTALSQFAPLPTGSPIPWTLLSGDPTRTRYVVGGGFQVYYSEAKPEMNEVITFDPRYVLVDHLGIMRAEYRTAEPDPALITRDIDLIVREAENSDGIAKLGYEAAHLFLCYPR